MTEQTRSVEYLQKALEMELTAVHQYQLHAHACEDWGLSTLASQMKEEMTEELGHSDLFAARIIFLGGTPKMCMAKTPSMASDIKTMFEHDLQDEKEAIEFYTKAARVALDEGDIGSRVLFEKIALEEEEHMAWLELQLSLLERIGEGSYIAKHI